jgi:TRAP-type C4-dicarboxylate transport system substrate-binding protein
MYVAMNRQKWDSLAPDIKKTIEGINEEWIVKTGKAWDDLDQSAKEWILKRGNEYITLSEEENERWAKTVAPLLDEFVRETEKKGAPGKAALQFALERVNQLNKEYPGPLTSR